MESQPLAPSDNAGENRRRETDQRALIRAQAARIRELIYPADEAPADD